MKIVLLVVGKTVESHFIQGIEEYSKRLAHYVPVSYTHLTLPTN